MARRTTRREPESVPLRASINLYRPFPLSGFILKFTISKVAMKGKRKNE
jgi:hypothetical protein